MIVATGIYDSNGAPSTARCVDCAAVDRLYAGYSLTELEFLARHLEASIRITNERPQRLRQ